MQCGALGMGLWASLELLPEPPGGLVSYAPKMHASSVRELIEGWRRAVARVLSSDTSAAK
jgi:glycerol kinase